MCVFQRIRNNTSSVLFIRADVLFVTTAGMSGFSFVQNDFSQVKTMKLLDIIRYLPPLFAELKYNECLNRRKNTTPYIPLLRQMTSNSQANFCQTSESANKGSESFSKQKPKNQKSQNATNLINCTISARPVDALDGGCSRCWAVTKAQPLTADYPSTGHATTHGHTDRWESRRKE